jgi:hypothetical protein
MNLQELKIKNDKPKGSNRVLQGGTWRSFASNVHADSSDDYDGFAPDNRDNLVGFRLVLKNPA